LSLSSQQLRKLNRIIALAHQLVTEIEEAQRSGQNGSAKKRRIRRSGDELVQFRRMLKLQRKKGIPVAELARQHGISSAYIYMLP
jgi:hypothetical protein